MDKFFMQFIIVIRSLQIDKKNAPSSVASVLPYSIQNK